MNYDAYFPMSWIYNTDGELVGDLFLRCVFDIGQPSTAALGMLWAQQHRESNGNVAAQVAMPFIVGKTALTIPVPWKLIHYGWEYNCKPEDAKYVKGIDAKPMNPSEEMLAVIKRYRRGASTFYAPFICFADGEFIQDTTVKAKAPFSMLVTPFSENAAGLYFLYTNRTVTTQCPSPIMADMLTLYKKSRNVDAFLENHITECFERMQTTVYVSDIKEQKTDIADAYLMKKTAAKNREQLTCNQVLGNSEPPYTVHTDTPYGKQPIRTLRVIKPIQMTADIFDHIYIEKEALMLGTRINLGTKPCELYIGATTTYATLGIYTAASGRESCVSCVTIAGSPKLERLSMVAAVPDVKYLDNLINLGTAGVTEIEMGIPYIAQPTQTLDLRSLGDHCASVHMEFGMQPAETISLSAPARYRYGTIVTQPKCGVFLYNTTEPTKHEGKFSVSDRHLTFYIPTFSRSHAIYVDTTDIVYGRHTISFVDTCYLFRVSRLYSELVGKVTQPEIYARYMQEVAQQSRKLGLPLMYANDELKYFADVPRTLTNVCVKVKTTTCIMLSSALNMTLYAVKPIKTLVLIELEEAVANAAVHIYGDIETLRVYAGAKQQYTYYVHGNVKNIICEKEGFSRDTRNVLVDAWGTKLTVHVKPGARINTIGTHGKETIIFRDSKISSHVFFGHILPLSKEDNAINNRVVLLDDTIHNCVNLIEDLHE